jgi:hypothetical protein
LPDLGHLSTSLFASPSLRALLTSPFSILPQTTQTPWARQRTRRLPREPRTKRRSSASSLRILAALYDKSHSSHHCSSIPVLRHLRLLPTWRAGPKFFRGRLPTRFSRPT